MSAPGSDPIADFWAWWRSDGSRLAEVGLGGAGYGPLLAEITPRVEAIDPGLDWELAPGLVAEHALVVSAGGSAELRRLAERWLRSAPDVTATWEYHPARQRRDPVRQTSITFDGAEIDLQHFAFHLQVDDDRQLIDVVVSHPRFATMSPEDRGHVGFLGLDWALGEHDVTRWIGDVEFETVPPGASVAIEVLCEVVDAMAVRTAEPVSTLLSGDVVGQAWIAVLNQPAKWIDRPLLDLHVSMTLPYGEQLASGLPGPGSLQALRDLEDRLVGLLGSRGRLLAHETSAGSRTFHVFIDSDDEKAASEIARAAAKWPDARLNSSPDPGWHAIRHLTG